jgi:hypothetical protein
MPRPDFTEIIVEETLEKLTLKGKSIIANMNEIDIGILEATFDRRVKGQGSRIKDGKHVLKNIWAILYESHRLRAVR